ncbi:MAG TPA: hypothetical protein VK852_11965 [Desulfobacterales bacterium]|nr:hypothetical protein [Desulfobacterales bacterium]
MQLPQGLSEKGGVGRQHGLDHPHLPAFKRLRPGAGGGFDLQLAQAAQKEKIVQPPFHQKAVAGLQHFLGGRQPAGFVAAGDGQNTHPQGLPQPAFPQALPHQHRFRRDAHAQQPVLDLVVGLQLGG